jgi:hypothetical protein
VAQLEDALFHDAQQHAAARAQPQELAQLA